MIVSFLASLHLIIKKSSVASVLSLYTPGPRLSHFGGSKDEWRSQTDAHVG